MFGVTGLLSLLWLPVAHAAVATDFFVDRLPGAPEPLLKQWAGNLEVTPETHGNFFFWFFQNRHIADRPRTVIWLNGGPGCSSMDGALMEIGPYRVNENGTLWVQDGSWDQFANVLFVDNPVGTGFSFVDTNAFVKELDEMADQFITFMEKWFAIFPEYQHDEIYLAGESYAGQHIPYIAKHILARERGVKWNLAGLLIGNGWISGPEQYDSYIPFAYESGILEKGSQADQIALRQLDTCKKDLENGGKDRVDTASCEAVMQEILRNTLVDEECINMYDVRLRDSYPSCGMNWPPDLTAVTPYLRRDDVKSALHVSPDKRTGWVECNSQVGNAFVTRESQPSIQLLPLLLEKVPITLFSGDKDMICNHIGTENIITSMEWNGAKGMELSPGMDAPVLDWTFEGEPAGRYQTARNLTYLRIYNSSHMVPFDYPRRTLDMVNRFMGVDLKTYGVDPMNSVVGDEETTLPESDDLITAPDTDQETDEEKGFPESADDQDDAADSTSDDDLLNNDDDDDDSVDSDEVQEATWRAYRRSGEVALVVLLFALGGWGYFLWRERRRRAGYSGVFGGDPYDGHGRTMNGGFAPFTAASEPYRTKQQEQRDVEAARDFDEAELDDLSGAHHHHHSNKDMDRERFGLSHDDSDDEEDLGHARTNGHVV